MMGVDDPQNRAVGIDPDGYIDLPLAGRIKAAGLTAEALRDSISQHLGHYLKNPVCSVTITEFRSQPVYVLGAVKDPGIRQLQGGRHLLEVLSMAGGLNADAGQTVLIARDRSFGTIPTGEPVTDKDTGTVTGEIKVADLMSGARPDLNIEIKPHDVITVSHARMVYVVGEVGKPGAFVLNERPGLSVLQAISLAGGLSRTAAPKSSRILRFVPGSADRHEENVNLSNILGGKGEDISLRADDILFVPNSLAKNASLRAIEAGIQVGTGLVIWK
jgi:polysaccharide export outer membrane protein